MFHLRLYIPMCPQEPQSQEKHPVNSGPIFKTVPLSYVRQYTDKNYTA